MEIIAANGMGNKSPSGMNNPQENSSVNSIFRAIRSLDMGITAKITPNKSTVTKKYAKGIPRCTWGGTIWCISTKFFSRKAVKIVKV